MAVTPDADAVHFRSRREERDLASALDEVFDITLGKPWNSGLSIWLGQPKRKAQQRFGLRQEVLIVYCPYPDPDFRIKRTIEEVAHDPEFKHRIEKFLVLVIHRGDEEVTKQDLAEVLDWVIVAFHAPRLTNLPHPAYISTEIARRVGIIDLFARSSPIQDDKILFGRNELIQRLIARATLQYENSGVFGLRKTGKTSVLLSLQRRLRDRPILIPFIDCRTPAVHGLRWWKLLHYVAKRCANHHTGLVKGTYSLETASEDFSEDMHRLFEATEVSHIILMFDEIEFITPTLSGALGKHWDADFTPFWQTIQVVRQELDNRLTFIVAGVNPSALERPRNSGMPNPIFQQAMPNFLKPLSLDAINDMIFSLGRYAGLKPRSGVYKLLLEEYGGHPYLIRLACSAVWERCRSTVSGSPRYVEVGDFTAAADDIEARLADPLKDILLSLVWWYPDEYDLMWILASSDDFVFFEKILKEQPEYKKRYEDYGILNTYTLGFRIKYLSSFLVTRGAEYKDEVSPFTRSDFPQDLVPEVPDLDELADLTRKRNEIEVGLRRAIMLHIGVECGFKSNKMARTVVKHLKPRSNRPDPADLFVATEFGRALNELYLIDMKDVIMGEWGLFTQLFGDKRRFEREIEFLNVGRRADAHTKPISPESKDAFVGAFHWIMQGLKRLPLS